MILRDWIKEDNEAVLKIEEGSFGDPWSKAMFDALFDLDIYMGAVAEEGVDIKGYVSTVYNGFELEIINIAVKSEFRRQKIGEKLMEWAIELGKKKGVENFYLEVRASNAPAKALYKKMGFKEIGLRRGYYNDGEDAVLMGRLSGE